MAETPENPFQDVLDALLDEGNPFPPRFLYRLSALEGKDLDPLGAVWPRIQPQRRFNLLEDLEELAETNLLLSFEAVCRLALTDEEPRARTLALRALWDSEEEDLIPIYLDILANDPDPETRAQAASSSGHFVYLGEIEEIPEELFRQIEARLLEIMDSDEPTLVRRRALEALSFSGRSAVESLIEEAYDYGDEDWLVSALFAMGRSANPRWEPLVLEKLEDESERVQLEAARAAGELDLQDAYPALLDLLASEDDELRMAAAWSLSQIGGEGVRQELETLLEETQDPVEAEFLEGALDNLSFTENVQDLNLLDLSDEDLDLYTGYNGDQGTSE